MLNVKKVLGGSKHCRTYLSEEHQVSLEHPRNQPPQRLSFSRRASGVARRGVRTRHGDPETDRDISGQRRATKPIERRASPLGEDPWTTGSSEH